MSPKAERTFLFFLTLFLAVTLGTKVFDYIAGSGNVSILEIVCFAGGLICVAVAWLQHFRGNRNEK